MSKKTTLHTKRGDFMKNGSITIIKHHETSQLSVISELTWVLSLLFTPLWLNPRWHLLEVFCKIAVALDLEGLLQVQKPAATDVGSGLMPNILFLIFQDVSFLEVYLWVFFASLLCTYPLLKPFLLLTSCSWVVLSARQVKCRMTFLLMDRCLVRNILKNSCVFWIKILVDLIWSLKILNYSNS